MRKPTPIAYTVNDRGCYNCISHKPSKGYPVIIRNGEYQTVIRYLYEQKFGQLPRSIVIRHDCDNERCINVDHVRTGTIAQNIKDRDNRGRTARGEHSGRAKLTNAAAIEIFKSRLSYHELASRFSVSVQTIRGIKAQRNWRHVTSR